MRTLHFSKLLALPAIITTGAAAGRCNPRPSSGSLTNTATNSHGSYSASDLSSVTGPSSLSVASTTTVSTAPTSSTIRGFQSSTSVSSSTQSDVGSSIHTGTLIGPDSTASVPNSSVSATSSVVSSSGEGPATSSGSTTSSDLGPVITPTSSFESVTVPPSTTSETTTETTTSSESTTTSETPTSSETFDPSKYTYYEVTLPVTFDTTAASTLQPSTTYELAVAQTGTPACAIDTSQSLRIGDSSGHRFVPKGGAGGTIGVLQNSDFPYSDATDDPTGAVEAANKAYYEGIVYHLSKAANGLFDLMTTVDGAVQYVTYNLADGGNVVLSSSASDGSNGQRALTSIFSVSCEGELQIKLPSGIQFTWKVGPDGVNTVMTFGPPRDGEAIQLISALGKPPGLDSATNTGPGRQIRRHGDRGRYGAMQDISRRMSPYTDGAYPRLPPRAPSDLTSRAKGYARPMTSNGCGSGALRKYVPQLSFGHCCDMHDYCYDNCASGRVEKCTEPYCSPGQFERCNSVFYDCMHETVCERIPWYHPIDRVNCEAAAVFYTGVVMTSLGGDAFKDATKQRCGAYCRSGAPFCGMGEDGAGGSCASTTDNSNCGECGQECDTGRGFACRGSKCVCTADVFNDSSNCGACGNKCPFGTKCSRGSCVCAADTCGNLCVNKQRHPRNCGSCGTVCATGICWDGVCKRPEDLPTPSGSAPTCLPTDAVKNGGFNGIPLLGASVPPSPWSIGDSKFGGIDARRVGPLSFVSLHTSGTTSPTDGIAFVQLVQDITMCPGKAYELTGTISMGNKGNLRIAVGNKVIFNKFYDDAPFQNRALGPLPFTAPASDDTFVSVRLVFYLDNNLIPIRFGLAVPQSATNLVLDDVSIYQP